MVREIPLLLSSAERKKPSKQSKEAREKQPLFETLSLRPYIIIYYNNIYFGRSLKELPA